MDSGDGGGRLRHYQEVSTWLPYSIMTNKRIEREISLEPDSRTRIYVKLAYMPSPAAKLLTLAE